MVQSAPVACALLLATCGCTRLLPTHNALPVNGATMKCHAENGTVAPGCSHQIKEAGDNYTLHFVEFDDQGRPYDATFGDASRQIDQFFKTVHDGVDETEETSKDGRKHSSPGLSVILFVHGWKHSARYDDSNLVVFRQLLGQLANVEDAAFCKRRVVGLYVGWRGAGTKLDKSLPENATMWSRKLAAEQIATGSFQRIVGGLKAIQQETPPRTDLVRKATDPDCSSRLKTTYVGHSFGGLIVMNGMSGDVIRRIMLDKEYLRNAEGDKHSFESARKTSRYADEMTIAINPAVEGARFDALYRAADEVSYPYYISPKFVAITTADDKSTRYLFPIGRIVNTITKRYPKGDEKGRRSARTTVGHDPQYLTRELLTMPQYLVEGGRKDYSGECLDWLAANLTYEQRASMDVKRAQAFYESVNGSYDANFPAYRERVFCTAMPTQKPEDKSPFPIGSGTLVMRNFGQSQFNRNMPVWNIRTHSPILREHGDITNGQLVAFLRQLYVDSMFFR